MTKSIKQPRKKTSNVLIGIDYAPRPSVAALNIASRKGGVLVTVVQSSKEPECFEISAAPRASNEVLIANRGQLQHLGEGLIEMADCPAFTKRERLLLEAAMDGAVSGAMQHVAKKLKRLINLNGEDRAKITQKVLLEIEKTRYEHHRRRGE